MPIPMSVMNMATILMGVICCPKVIHAIKAAANGANVMNN